LFEFFKPEADQKGLKFSFKKGSADTKVSVYSDRDKLSVILSNLIDNALKFTSRGTVEFGYVADNASLEFYVSDTGTGITSEQKKVIFERFRQGSESLSRNYEGTGLGLYISKKYTEILGGKIRVDNNIYSSVEGPGAKFSFSIPLHQELPSKDQSGDGVSKPEAKLSIPRKKLNILIAEDDKPSQLFLTKMVQPFSSETFFAATGTGAVDLCRNNPGIDLILMDIKLAEMDGYEATRQIRNFNKDVIIIAQTAYAQSGDRDLALGSGCNDYITKPIREAEFYIILNKYFNTGIKNTLPDKKQL
jgi:CheY-like chemotaxis protein